MIQLFIIHDIFQKDIGRMAMRWWGWVALLLVVYGIAISSLKIVVYPDMGSNWYTLMFIWMLWWSAWK